MYYATRLATWREALRIGSAADRSAGGEALVRYLFRNCACRDDEHFFGHALCFRRIDRDAHSRNDIDVVALPPTKVLPATSTNGNGLPLAKIALPCDQRYASSAVHSEREVGLE
jgi:hypothetical protein